MTKLKLLSNQVRDYWSEYVKVSKQIYDSLYLFVSSEWFTSRFNDKIVYSKVYDNKSFINLWLGKAGTDKHICCK